MNKLKLNRCAIVCTTQYQILMAIKYVMTDVHSSNTAYDLYVMNTFVNADEIISNLKKIDLFENVYEVKNIYNLEKNRFKSDFKKVLMLLFPERTIKKLLYDKNENLKNYDIVVASGWNYFFIDLVEINEAKVIMIEDGLASYSGEFRDAEISKRYYFFEKIVKKGAHQIHPEFLYLNSKNFLSGKFEYPVYNFPPIEDMDKYENIAFSVFSYQKNYTYASKKFIMLQTNTLEKCKKSGNDEEIIQRILEKNLGAKLIARLHPGAMNAFRFCCDIDEIRNMWELECMENITEDKVLISTFSSAMTNSKILYNKEPYLIFLYKLIIKEESEWYLKYEEIAKRMTENYRNKQKIFIPETIKDLENILTILVTNREKV